MQTISQSELFDSTRTFADLGLGEPLLRAINKFGFQHPTIVQSQLIPLSLQGKDILGRSKTGSGKTAAFGLPVLQRVDPHKSFAALILVPTRELCIQVAREIRELGQFTEHKVLPVYGGQPIRTQAERLRRHPNIIVGTPGRIMDMHSRGLLHYNHVDVAILDEVDRMLDIGFRDDIRRILGGIKHPHQTIFVSATISPEIDRLARQFMHEPVDVNVSSQQSLTVAQVRQRYFSVQPWDKNRLLLYLLTHEKPALTLIFCRTKQSVDALSSYLRSKNIDAHAIHGDMYQSKRNRVMHKLREGQLSVLVASDLAARGLDVDDITHVINFDVPEDPEVYVHRIGRTARAGRDGVAWTFITPEQGELLSQIEQLTNVEVQREELDGFEPGPIPPDILARQVRDAERLEQQRLQQNRLGVRPPTAKEAQDATLFPGGVVPKAVPKRRLGGRVRTTRG